MSQKTRRPLVGGNWKMHLTSAEAHAFATRFVAERGAAQSRDLSRPGSGACICSGMTARPLSQRSDAA